MMIRRGPLKLITTHRNANSTGPGSDELLLFDLERDPGETVSFGGDPAYAADLTDLLATVQAQSRRPPAVWRFLEHPAPSG